MKRGNSISHTDVVAARLEHDDRNRLPENVSLESQTLIDGDEHVELSLGRARGAPVLEATQPAC
jgi:hypothetical protein